MRFILITAGLMLSMNVLLAQEPLDAVRYSWLADQGTARSQGIGGAMNALGGDISALATNPAGIGVYKTSEFVLTPGINFNNTKSSYRNGGATDSKTSFTYGPIGVVWGIPSYRGDSKWKNMSVGLSLSQVANFNQNIYVTGDNNQSSFSEKYIDQIFRAGLGKRDDVETVVKDSRFRYGPAPAFLTYLIDTITNPDDNKFGYFSSASYILDYGGSLKQQQIINTTGGISSFNIGLGGNYNDVFYIGGSINVYTLRYTRNSSFRESDATGDPNNDFNYFLADDYLRTDGTGVSINLGVIARPVEALRVGLSFHSPSWYSFKDTYYSSLTTDTEGYAGVQTQSSLDLNDGYAGEYTYRYKSPLKVGAGIAYIFGTQADVSAQKGFVSADVEYVNYKSNNFNTMDRTNQDDKDYFTDLNRTMNRVFKPAVNVRVGGELKFETVMVRAGLGYYGNPYTNNYFNNQSADMVNGGRMNISGGLGWRNKGMFVDLTYVQQIVQDGYYPYRLDEGVFNVAKLNNSTGKLLLTLGFKF